MAENTNNIKIRRLSVFGVYGMAGDIAYLLNRNRKDPIVYENGSVSKNNRGYILFTLQDLANAFERYGILQAQKVELRKLAERYEEKYINSVSKNIDEEDYDDLQSVVSEVEAVFKNYLWENDFTNSRTTVGRLNYNKLLSDGPASLFEDESLTNELESNCDFVVSDLKDAIKCAAFGLANPCVFMSLRAAEGMTKYAYEKIFKQPPSEDMDWNDIQKEISDKLGDGAQLKELDGHFHFIRQKRNDAAHPPIRFKQLDAEDTLINVSFAIKELSRLSQKLLS